MMSALNIALKHVVLLRLSSFAAHNKLRSRGRLAAKTANVNTD